MQGQLDSCGHALYTGSKAAAGIFNAGMHSFICWRTDTFDLLDAAIAADPDFALAKLAKG